MSFTSILRAHSSKAGSPNWGRGSNPAANTFVNVEKLIDEKLFLVEYNISETIPSRKMSGPRTFV